MHKHTCTHIQTYTRTQTQTHTHTHTHTHKLCYNCVELMNRSKSQGFKELFWLSAFKIISENLWTLLIGTGGGWFGLGTSKTQTPFVTTPSGAKQGYIGITMLSLTPSLILDLKQRAPDFPNVSHGVLVYRITIGSPAHVWVVMRPLDNCRQILGQFYAYLL